MKKILLFFLCLTVLSACASCRKKEDGTADFSPEVFHDIFFYEDTGKIDCMAADENGLLYTTVHQVQERLEQMEDGSSLKRLLHIQLFSVYDLDGNLLSRNEVMATSGTVSDMFVMGSTLYCAAEGLDEETQSIAPSVFEISTETWELLATYPFPMLSAVLGVEKIDTTLYVLGIPKVVSNKTYALHPDVNFYTWKGESICCVDIAAPNPQVMQLMVDFPIQMGRTEDNTLAIYRYTEEKGFCFTEYDPASGTLTDGSTCSDNGSAVRFAMCDDKKGYIYGSGKCLYYASWDGVIAELARTAGWISRKPVCGGGYAFYREVEGGGTAGTVGAAGTVRRISVSRLLQDNREISFLMRYYGQEAEMPFGCGYRMDCKILPEEQIALKVLAQDKDFDLCILRSRENSSYNIRDNGAFYLLNEVDGVQEYLDACFPYLKEAATTKDGDIWMLPVSMAVPCLFYQKASCDNAGLDFSGSMDFAEFLKKTKQLREADYDKLSISKLDVFETLIGQYQQKYDSFDTPLFRDYAALLLELGIRENGGWNANGAPMLKLASGESNDFYYVYENQQTMLKYNIGYAADSPEQYGIAGLPKLAGDIKNYGTVTFLVVNPNSGNLKAALDYISALSKYMLTQKDSFLLADVSTYTDSPLMREMYGLYADVSVWFAMDEEVYESKFAEYWRGEIGLEEMIAEIERRRKIFIGE